MLVLERSPFLFAVVDYRAASSIEMATAYAEIDDLASSRYLVAEQIIKLLRDEHQTDECRCSPPCITMRPICSDPVFDCLVFYFEDDQKSIATVMTGKF